MQIAAGNTIRSATPPNALHKQLHTHKHVARCQHLIEDCIMSLIECV